MRRNSLVLFLGLVTLSAATGESGKDAPSKDDKEEGFVSIFDGKTVKGWKGATSGYTAEEGVLVCQKKGGGNLFTEKEYGDFVFRFDFKFEPGGNNGVSVRGHEIQILDDYSPGHKDLKGCQYHGSIYCKVAAKRGATKKAGEWNSQEIRVEGTRWKVTVNGIVTVDEDISKVVGLEGPAKTKRAPIGFLGHGTRVEFRNLRVQELTGK
jgi:hypothetical protein